LPLGKTSRSFRRVGVARRHLGQKRLVASNSPKLSGAAIPSNSTQRETAAAEEGF